MFWRQSARVRSMKFLATLSFVAFHTETPRRGPEISPERWGHWTGPTDLPTFRMKSRMRNAWPEAKVHSSCFHASSLFCWVFFLTHVWSNVEKAFFLETSLFALNMTWLHCEVYWDLNLDFKVAVSQWYLEKGINPRRSVLFLVLCMSRFVKERSSRWNRGTFGPNLLCPVAKVCTLKPGPMLKF